MKKKINILLTAFIFVLFFQSSFAATHIIFVGQGGNIFSPNSITNVVVGDIIHWEYVGGFHTSTSVSVPVGADTWGVTMDEAADNFDYTVDVAGTYTYRCNPHGSGGMTGSFVASLPTGVLQGGIYSTLSLAPNPASEEIRVEFSAEKSFNGTVLIYDASGILVKEERAKVKAGNNLLSFNISKFAKGTYIFNLTDAETALVAKKFVKE